MLLYKHTMPSHYGKQHGSGAKKHHGAGHGKSQHGMGKRKRTSGDCHNAQELLNAHGDRVLTVANRSHGVIIRRTIELDYHQLHCRSDRM